MFRTLYVPKKNARALKMYNKHYATYQNSNKNDRSPSLCDGTTKIKQIKEKMFQFILHISSQGKTINPPLLKR
jgi:hypothetical protein